MDIEQIAANSKSGKMNLRSHKLQQKAKDTHRNIWFKFGPKFVPTNCSKKQKTGTEKWG